MNDKYLNAIADAAQEQNGEIFRAIVSSAFLAAVTFQRHHGQKSPEEQKAVLVKMARAILPRLDRPLSQEEREAFEGLGVL